MSLRWDDHATLYGTRIKVSFFDGEASEREAGLAARVLPFLRGTRPTVMFTERDRRNFYCDRLSAQPDVVLAHGSGLIAVEYKSFGRRNHSRGSWQKEIRLKDMLQCMIGGYAVAQTYKKTTACVLRYHNVCYLLSPAAEMMHSVLDLAPLALQYHEERERVSASQLAEFAMDKIRRNYPIENTARAEAGRLAHESLLRR